MLLTNQEFFTVYTDWFPTESMELMFDLKQTEFQNLSITPEVLESERGVVTCWNALPA